jgi:putative oxidoreductase
MKKFLYTPLFHAHVNSGILVLRITAGMLMLLNHGLPKLNMLLGPGPVKFGDPIGLGVLPSLTLLVFAEFFCSLLIIAGFLTRFATIPLIIEFLIILFIVKAGAGIAKNELDLFFLSVYVVILLTGPGKFSLDRLFVHKNEPLPGI